MKFLIGTKSNYRRTKKWNYTHAKEKIYVLIVTIRDVFLWVKKKLIARNGLVTEHIKRIIIAIDAHLLSGSLTL